VPAPNPPSSLRSAVAAVAPRAYAQKAPVLGAAACGVWARPLAAPTWDGDIHQISGVKSLVNHYSQQ